VTQTEALPAGCMNGVCSCPSAPDGDDQHLGVAPVGPVDLLTRLRLLTRAAQLVYLAEPEALIAALGTDAEQQTDPALCAHVHAWGPRDLARLLQASLPLAALAAAHLPKDDHDADR
jgi:hypothetical protein